MSSEEERPARFETEREALTDPKAMRALAHPLRMALLELLGANEQLTATQASELLGESPANCAFHLRTLAKYGFVEETGGGRGRERPWRSTRMRLRVRSEQDDPQAAIAAATLGHVLRERWFDRARQAFSTGSSLPELWREAKQATRGQCYLTPEQLTDLAEEVLAVISRYEKENNSPATRAAAAMPVELLFFAYPLMGVTVPAS